MKKLFLLMVFVFAGFYCQGSAKPGELDFYSQKDLLIKHMKSI